jgi:hypothetical protein
MKTLVLRLLALLVSFVSFRSRPSKLRNESGCLPAEEYSANWGEPSWQGTKESLWFNFTAPGIGNLVVESSAGVLYDKLLLACRGTTLTSLVQFGAARYDQPLVVPVKARERVQIALKVDHPTAEEALLVFRFVPAPAHDELLGAKLLSRKTVEPFEDSTLGAAAEVGEQDFGQRTIWYRWKAPVSGKLRFLVEQLAGFTRFEVLNESRAKIGEYAWPRQFFFQAEVAAGQEYYIKAFGLAEADQFRLGLELHTTKVEPSLHQRRFTYGKEVLFKVLVDSHYAPPSKLQLDSETLPDVETGSPFEHLFAAPPSGYHLFFPRLFTARKSILCLP